MMTDIINNNNTTSSSANNFYGKPELDTSVVGGLVTFYVVVATCAIASNVTILIAIIRRFVPRNTVNLFFSSLAISDILMVVLSLLDCCAYLNGGWEFTEIGCKIQSLLLEISFSASTLTLVAVSCERYLLICHPHMKRRTLRNIYHLLAVVWIMSFVITSPLLDGYIVYEDVDDVAKTSEFVCGNKGWSRHNRLIYYSTYSMVVYVIPLLLMAFTHWRISRSVRVNHQRQKYNQSSRLKSVDKNAIVCFTIEEENKEREPIERTKTITCQKVLCEPLNRLKMKAMNSIERESKRNDRRIKAVRMLFVVTVTFFFLWTPFIILRIFMLSGTPINSYIYKFSEVLILSSTAVNGFIYAYMSPPFRKAFKAILCCQDKSEVAHRCTGTTLSNSEDQRRLKSSNFSTDGQGTLPLKKKESTLRFINVDGFCKTD